MKSVCCSGTNPRLVCRPWKNPWPSSPPTPIAAFRLAKLILILREEAREAQQLVVLEDARCTIAATAMPAPTTPSSTRNRGWHASDHEHHDQDDDHDDRRAEVRLDVDEEDRQRRHQQQPPHVSHRQAVGRRSQYVASARIIASTVNSEGWTWIGPKENQRCEPSALEPRGACTSRAR